MAINSNIPNAKSSASIPASSTYQAQPIFQTNPQTAPTQTAPSMPRMSFMKLGSLGGLSRSPSSEILQKTINLLGEYYKANTEKGWEVVLLPVDNCKETNLAFSGVIVCVKKTASPQTGVAYHTLILEESGEPIPPIIQTYNDGQTSTQFEEQRAACDAYNDLYDNTVREIVSRAYPNTAMTTIDAQIVPRGFDLENKDLLHALALNAQLPCYTYIESQENDFQEIDLTQLERDATLGVRISFNEPQRIDYAGLPSRNDINIALTASSINRNQQNYSLNSQDRTKMIASIGGYIDPIWAPLDNSGFAPMQMYNAPQPKFAARFVITDLENKTRTTIPAQLLALVAGTVLRENNNWYPYFSPRPKSAVKKDVDIRDIGAINIEGNVFNDPSGFGPCVDTKAASFTPLELGRLIQSTFIPGIYFSLKVSECGADTWYNSPFGLASSNHPGAINSILKGADKLTGGYFSQFYSTNESPVLINNERVHTGWYIDSDGTKRDISDIDYLAIMNIVGKKDNKAGSMWQNTFLFEGKSLPLRLSTRRKMIESVISGEIRYTGFARIVTFTNRFIESLTKACVKAGLDLRTINPSVSGDYFAQRARAEYMSQVQVMPGNTGLFSPGFSGQQNNQQRPTMFSNRIY